MPKSLALAVGGFAFAAVCMIFSILGSHEADAQPFGPDGIFYQARLSSPSPPARFDGGSWNFYVYGTFGGATAAIQLRRMDGAWVDVEPEVLRNITADTPAGYMTTGVGEYRLNIVGGVGTSLSWEARRVN